jgi:aspartate aminotransferase
MYSSPPLHGARIAAKILNSTENFNDWMSELQDVSNRILKMRKALYDELVALNTPGTWNHIIDQIGMFSYTGLTAKQCEHLTSKYHIYLVKNGRISMTGVNTNNVAYLAKAIKDAVQNA